MNRFFCQVLPELVRNLGTMPGDTHTICSSFPGEGFVPRPFFLASLTRTCQKTAFATDPSFLANFPTSQPHFLADSFLTAHFVVQVPIRSEACQSRRRVQSKSNRVSFIIWQIALVALIRGGRIYGNPRPKRSLRKCNTVC